MRVFKVGDSVWSKDQFVDGDYYPSFCTYEILDIADNGSYAEWLVLRHKNNQEMNFYSKLCFKTKNEAIENMIKYLKDNNR